MVSIAGRVLKIVDEKLKRYHKRSRLTYRVRFSLITMILSDGRTVPRMGTALGKWSGDIPYYNLGID